MPSQIHYSPRRGAPLRFVLLLAGALALLAGAGRAAPGVPAGPALAVSPEDGYFLGPDATVDAAGQLIVVWYGDTSAQPGSDIYARRYARGGVPLGPAFRVNAATAGEQRRPSVGVAADGSFVVAWDTNTQTVAARRFAADGAPRGDDIAVSQRPALRAFDSDIAVAPDGSFAIVWDVSDPASADRDVALRRFDADGVPLGGEMLPYNADATLQLNPAVAALPAGGLAVVWEQTDLLAPVPASTIWLQRLDGAGALFGPVQEVASATGEELRDPALAAGADGSLHVAWASFSVGNGTVLLRAYNADGQPSGPGVPISAPVQAERFTPAVAVGADGSTAVAWLETAAREGAPDQIVVRRLAAGGAPESEEFEPRPPESGSRPADALFLALGPVEGGPLWIGWAQAPPADQEITRSAIYARRYVDQLTRVALPLLRR